MDIIKRYNQYESKSGSYFPAMFCIYLSDKIKSIDVILKNESISDGCFNSDRLIFYHEYLHFLQDITCGYSISNLYHILNSIRFLSREVSEKKAIDDFQMMVPFKIKDKSYQECSILQNICFNGCIYDSLPRGTVVTKVDDNYEEKWIRDSKITIPRYEVCLSSGHKVNFGAQALLEGMAHVLQRKASIEKPYFFAIPYDLPKAVFQYYLPPSCAGNEAMLLDLCEFALDTQHPAQTFVESLRIIKEYFSEFKDCDNLYKKLGERWFFKDVKNNKNTEVKEKPQEMSAGDWCNYLNKEITDMVTGTYVDPHYKKFGTWLLRALKEGVEWRKEKPIFSKIYNGTFTHSNITRNFLRYMIGNRKLLPPVYNDSDGKFASRDDDAEDANHFAHAIGALWGIVFYVKTECPCIKTCNGSAVESGTASLVNESCKKSPWDAIKEGRKCPLGIVGRAFNLDGMTFEKV